MSREERIRQRLGRQAARESGEWGLLVADLLERIAAGRGNGADEENAVQAARMALAKGREAIAVREGRGSYPVGEARR